MIASRTISLTILGDWMKESEEAEEFLHTEHHRELDLEVRLKTRRRLSRHEEEVLADMVHEMALVMDRFICERNKKED